MIFEKKTVINLFKCQVSVLSTKEITINELNPHMMPSLEIEPGPQWWEASALATAPTRRILFIKERKKGSPVNVRISRKGPVKIDSQITGLGCCLAYFLKRMVYVQCKGPNPDKPSSSSLSKMDTYDQMPPRKL